jgi:hypothetical protein
LCSFLFGRMSLCERVQAASERVGVWVRRRIARTPLAPDMARSSATCENENVPSQSGDLHQTLFSWDSRVYDWRDDAIHMIFVAQ